MNLTGFEGNIVLIDFDDLKVLAASKCKYS